MVPLLVLAIALLFRLAPYPYWQNYISKLRDGIRNGFGTKYSLNVADCPGQLLWLFLLRKKDVTYTPNRHLSRLHPRFAH